METDSKKVNPCNFQEAEKIYQEAYSVSFKFLGPWVWGTERGYNREDREVIIRKSATGHIMAKIIFYRGHYSQWFVECGEIWDYNNLRWSRVGGRDIDTKKMKEFLDARLRDLGYILS